MPLFLLFLLVPVIEIALFIKVGGLIGLAWTLLIVILTAILGAILVRSQGVAVLASIRSSFQDFRDPTEPLVHGAMILFSGALLLTPGFFTDAVGFVLLVPGVRNWVFRYLKARISVQHFSGGQSSRTTDSSVIDGEYQDLDKTRNPSGWTRH